MGAEVEILLGPAGSGKTSATYREMVDAAYREPGRQFYLIVPEQAGSSTEQRVLSVNRERTGRPGFFNVDILGFSRLAHKIFEMKGRDSGEVLGEYGKIILLRAVIAEVSSRLELYRGSVDRRGFVDEMKSLISEFLLFDILPEDLEEAGKTLEGSDLQLQRKLQDVITIYRAFRENPVFDGTYTMAEEMQGCLAALLEEEEPLPGIDGAVFYFDGFTGFTAGQRKVIRALIPRASHLHFSITMDPDDTENGMFIQSREMLEQLEKMCPQRKIRTLERRKKDHVLAHLEQYAFRFPIREYKAPGAEVEKNLAVWSTENPLEELRVILEDIHRMVRTRGQRYRDFAILTPDLKGLGSYLDMTMREYELPYFCDITRSFTNNPIIDAQLLSLEIVDTDFGYESVFSFLKTGVLDAALDQLGIGRESIELMENHVIAHGIRGKRLWKKHAAAFLGKREPGEEEKEALKKVDAARELFLDVLSPVLPFAGKKEVPVEKMIAGMLQLGRDERLDLGQRVEAAEKDLRSFGYLAEARAYRGLDERFADVLEKTAAILKDTPMTVHELRETLLAGTRELHLGVIPPTLDRILVGDLDRTRIDGVKYLYIMNMNDGKFPRPRSEGGILSDRDRLKLDRGLRDKELAPDEGRKRFQEQFSLYLAMSKAVERLVLTYSLTDRSGSDTEPSFLLGRILRIFPYLSVTHKLRSGISGAGQPDRLNLVRLMKKEESGPLTEKEALEKSALVQALPECPGREAHEEQGHEKLSPELMGNIDLKISISGMEKYAECPYSFFLSIILGLRPRREHTINKTDIGTVMHAVLEGLFREVRDRHGNDWAGIDEEKLRDAAVRLARESAVAYEIIPPDYNETDEEQEGKNALILSELEEYASLSAEILRLQISESRMRPEVLEGRFDAEFTVERPDGTPEKVDLTGVVDRLDTYRDEDGQIYIRILDYKTSDKSLDPVDLRDGRNLQLALYSRVLTEIFRKQEGAVIPAGMYYYHISRPKVDTFSKKALEKTGSEEAAAQQASLQKLRLRGPINISPGEEEEEESGKPLHYVLEIQEKGAVGENRELQSAKTLMLTTYAGNGRINGNPMLLDTEEMLGLGEYSLYKMKNMAKEVLKGEIPRDPTTKEGRIWVSCKYCDAKEVCRLRAEEVPGRYVKASKDKIALLKELAETGNVNPVPLRNARLKKQAEREDILFAGETESLGDEEE